MAPLKNQHLKPLMIYGSLSLAVMLPMLLPGFILTLDMAFTPELRMPEQMSSSYLFHAGLHYINVIVPGEIIQKCLLLAILLLSGLGMHALVRYIHSSKNHVPEFADWGAYIAGALYMINPYTYSRFMVGQYAVLLGYALLPFFARALIQFFAVPTLKRGLTVSGWLTIIGIVSLHTLGLAAVLVIVALAAYAWRCRKNCHITLTTLKYGLIAVLTFIVASGYWLVPLLTGTNSQGQAVAQFNANDQQAFATSGGNALGKLGYILQLQGFWAEREGMYLLPQDQIPAWGIVVLAIWLVVGIGIVWMWRNHRGLAALCIGAAAVATTLAITGTGSLFALAGFREPHKFVGLVALTYALFAGFGATALLSWSKRRGETILNTGAIIILILPILLTPTMLFGFSGQLSPREYPPDWYVINQRLNRDRDEFKVLSLPWHLYMHYPFAGRIIVNPSDMFFDKPTIASNEVEFENASPTFPDPAKKMLTDDILPDAANNPRFGEQLNELDIKYILLAKTYDFKKYAYLDDRTDLQLISETPNLKLYRNLSYAE